MAGNECKLPAAVIMSTAEFKVQVYVEAATQDSNHSTVKKNDSVYNLFTLQL